MAERALRHSFSKELAHLDDSDREAVERLASSLVKRLVEIPTEGTQGRSGQSLERRESMVFLNRLEDTNGSGEGGDR